MAFHVEKVKRALWRQHFVDQEQHVTFWWDCGKKTVQHNSNFVQLHAYESISESDSAFCGFWWGARSTTLIATEHFVDPKKWLHSFGNPYQITYFWSTWRKIISSLQDLVDFFLIRWITCKREEIKSKWIYILQRTHQRMYQKAHVDRQSLFSHALLFCLTCQEESSVLSTKPLERQTSHKPQKPNFPKRS